MGDMADYYLDLDYCYNYYEEDCVYGGGGGGFWLPRKKKAIKM